MVQVYEERERQGLTERKESDRKRWTETCHLLSITIFFPLQDIDGIIKYMEEALRETDPAAFLMVS